MLFGAPLALLGGHLLERVLGASKARATRLKAIIELMASVCPVSMLGFLGALGDRTHGFIEGFLIEALAAIITVPAALIIGAACWQLMSRATQIRLARWRLWAIGGVLFVGIAAAGVVGPIFERLFFGGSLISWLNGLNNPEARGSAIGGWLLLLLPVSIFGAIAIFSRFVDPWIRRRMNRTKGSMQKAARFDALKLGVLAFTAFALALGVGGLLSIGGFDVRAPLPLVGAAADTFDQRNALVVGFVMGFAIIPIIYTIADDALSTVPGHLRSASLGAGATPWQTTMRIIVPTAMSGLFSALMIGLGRAVGETMIVLMAAGNTPVMNLNIFDGMRTLSANIATELPEAPIGSTHYRTLFLAALALFIMTFVLNTFAEVIRLRFRKRAYQL